MQTGPTIQDFFRQFPDDDTCLDYLMVQRHGDVLECPKCSKEGKFHRIRRHPAYECAWCGFEIFPMVGTLFHRSHVSLQKWFYAMYLFCTTRHGVPAKELQRQLGISYPSALRMAHKIREYMGRVDGDDGLSGHVEVDETYIGGRKKGGKRGRGAPGKTVVFGMVERDGDMMTRVVPNVRRVTLEKHILENVAHGSRISSDELSSYAKLARHGFKHGAVNHGAEEWARGDTHVNTAEGFWSRLKLSIRGTHVHVSAKHLPKYLGEFEFRFNMRKRPAQMFSHLLASL
jgi:transposase-like protein/predicted RNA-binding Zn-ribbon protein involved in translation (DUF1610 family)